MYQFLAAQQAFTLYGKSYADYIEEHTADLVARGYDVADRDLGQALSGNDGN